MFTHLSADVFPLVSAISRRPYTIPPWPKPSEAILRLREEIRQQAEIKELKARREDYYKTYFENIIKKHKEDRAHALQINPFSPQLATWQMEGLGIFIPEGSTEKQPIFVAKKKTIQNPF